MRSQTKTLLHWHLRGLLLLCALAGSQAANAQDIATAEALFNSGVEDMKAGRYETGCKAIGESQRLDPRPGTLFTLATCEREWGRLATAVARYGDYIALYERMPEAKKADPVQSERYKEAKAMRAKLLPEVPQLTLSLPKGAPAGTVVKRNGEVIGVAALGLNLPVDPGEHAISTQAPGGPVRKRKVTIKRGEKKQVILGVSAAETDQLPELEGSRSPPSYAAPIVAFCAGAVGLGLGVGFGAAAMSKRSELDMACADRNCPRSEEGNLNDTKTFSHVSTAGLVLAGVGAATGTVLLLLRSAPGKENLAEVGVRLGAGYMGLEGEF